MKTYTTAEYISEHPTACALGCFDGVHIGHIKLIEETLRLAKELSVKSAVWSFDTPPKNYFSPSSVPLITTPAEKQEQMQKLGVDLFVSVPFEKEILSLTAEEFFCDILIKRMKVRHVICGYNYRFGKGGKGDAELLRTLCEEHGIGLSVIPEVMLGGVAVSSSAIRTALLEGRISEATMMLGRPYSLTATVCDGQHLGRQLGFPTINQVFSADKLLPLHGVYLSRSHFDNEVRYGITNVGVRPTVSENMLCAETHIFDFTGDLYGETVTVELIDFIRPEQKFSSIEALSTQVNKDIAKARKIISH